MKTKFVTIVLVLVLAALPLNVAFADGQGSTRSISGLPRVRTVLNSMLW